MSRSYKKYPFCKDRESVKWGKRYCNKRVRNTKDIPNGKAYRKVTEPWDFIYDYSCSETWEEYKEWFKRSNKWWQNNKEPDYWDWYKVYKMK